jgi:hypothetical protein
MSRPIVRRFAALLAALFALALPMGSARAEFPKPTYDHHKPAKPHAAAAEAPHAKRHAAKTAAKPTSAKARPKAKPTARAKSPAKPKQVAKTKRYPWSKKR